VFLCIAVLLFVAIIPLSAQEATEVVVTEVQADVPAENTQPPVTPEPVTEAPSEVTAVPTDAPVEVTEPPVVTEPSAEVTAPPVAATEPTPVPVSPEPTLSPVFAETFDSGDLSNWRLGSGWTLVSEGSGQALQVSGTTAAAQYAVGNLTDVAMEIRFQSDVAAAQLLLQQSESGVYAVSLMPDGFIEVSLSGVRVATAVVPSAGQGAWRVLRFSTAGDALRVTVDGIEAVAIADPLPLGPGSVSFAAVFVDGTGTFSISDVALWSVQPVELPVAEEPIVTEAPIAEATTEATAEATEVPMPDRVIVVPVEVVEAPSDLAVPLAAPALTAPAGGAVLRTTLRPTLSWRRIAEATQYQVRIVRVDENIAGDDDDTATRPTSPINNIVATINAPAASVLTISYVPASPLLFGEYFWQICAVDVNFDPATDCSPLRNFELHSPYNAAPVLNRMDSANVTVSWTPISWATSYTVQVTRAGWAAAQTQENINAGTLQATFNDLPEGTYSWRVRAMNLTTPGGWSTVGRFQVDLIP
jgi:hypothetical protein